MSVESAFSGEHVLHILGKLARYYMNYSHK